MTSNETDKVVVTGEFTWTVKQYQEGVEAVIESLDYHWHKFRNDSDPVVQASALVEINYSMIDLISWHRNYDCGTGTLGPIEDE